MRKTFTFERVDFESVSVQSNATINEWAGGFIEQLRASGEDLEAFDHKYVLTVFVDESTADKLVLTASFELRYGVSE